MEEKEGGFLARLNLNESMYFYEVFTIYLLSVVYAILPFSSFFSSFLSFFCFSLEN